MCNSRTDSKRFVNKSFRLNRVIHWKDSTQKNDLLMNRISLQNLHDSLLITYSFSIILFILIIIFFTVVEASWIWNCKVCVASTYTVPWLSFWDFCNAENVGHSYCFRMYDSINYVTVSDVREPRLCVCALTDSGNPPIIMQMHWVFLSLQRQGHWSNEAAGPRATSHRVLSGHLAVTETLRRIQWPCWRHWNDWLL